MDRAHELSATSRAVVANELESKRDKAINWSPGAVKITPFWGHDDYITGEDWIELYDMIASDSGYTEANKKARLGGHLRKHALAWYMETMKQCGDLDSITWASLKDMFIKYFTSYSSMERGSDVSSTISSLGS